MTPAEVEALDDETYSTFVTYMQREAFETKQALDKHKR